TQQKLASLGTLTAGIAHEIKNPLNFVNNFAELSVDLLGDLEQDLSAQRDRMEPKAARNLEDTVADLRTNVAKINEHGKRANRIVNGMLLLSRGKSGERMAVDVNTMAHENLNLAYHGMRARDANFNVTLKEDFDPAVGTLLLVPQDISRVILNLANNACYAA